MDSILKWVFLITGGIVLTGSAYFLIKRYNLTKENTNLSPEIKEDGIREKIILFLSEYAKDWRNYRYTNYYSKQFDVKTEKNNYTMKLKRVSTINELGVYDNKNALIELVKLVEDIIGVKFNNLNNGECLFLLQNYYELKSEKEILDEISRNIISKDLERYNNYKKDIKNRIAELIDKAKSDNKL